MLTVAESRRFIQFHAPLKLPGVPPATPGSPVPALSPIPWQREALAVTMLLKSDPESLLSALQVSLTVAGDRYLAEARLADDTNAPTSPSAPTASDPAPRDTMDLASLVIDESDQAIRLGDATCPFSDQQSLLFRLFAVLYATPHRWISFTSLHASVWEYPAEDATIKDALNRLRQHLRDHGLGVVAACIKSRTLRPDGLHARFLGTAST